MKAMRMGGQTRLNGSVVCSSHRKMAPFLDRKVNEGGRDPGGGSLTGKGNPEAILQIKEERERKTGVYTPPTPPSGSWLVGTWQM